MRSNIHEQLIEYLGGPARAAKALGVSQPSASGWVTGKHGMSGAVAMRAERLTKGKFKAWDLVRDKTRERGPAPKKKPKEKKYEPGG